MYIVRFWFIRELTCCDGKKFWTRRASPETDEGLFREKAFFSVFSSELCMHVLHKEKINKKNNNDIPWCLLKFYVIIDVLVPLERRSIKFQS